MAEKATQTFYDIVKTCRGGLSLSLPAFDASLPNRNISLDYNATKIRVMRTFALGIFTDPVLERMYKEGYFRVEPEKAFEQEVEEIFYPIEGKENSYSDQEILAYLQKGNRVKIKEIVAESPVSREQVITLASENIDSLSQSMIKDLEEILRVELIIDEE